MSLDFDVCYRALQARDTRFDGAFFVGVRTTGIYCRSICSARTPLATSCRFFCLAAAAEAEGFRPCLRCRPETAPGLNHVSFAEALLSHVRERAHSEGGLRAVAHESGVSERQMRRILVAAFGVTPVQIQQTERLLLAKRLLQETRLPIIEVGTAAGFQSLRRFNALFKKRYQLAPSHFRERAGTVEAGESPLHLRLGYRPPYAWPQMLAFLAARAIPGVEMVAASTYSRVVHFGDVSDVIEVSQAREGDHLILSLPARLVSHLPTIIHRLRSLFDLDANPAEITGHLGNNPHLGDIVSKCPGLRIPGAWCSFEVAIRAVLGQQVSVAGATTLAGRLVSRFGQKIVTSRPALDTVFFEPSTLAHAPIEGIQSIGLPLARARALQTIAQAFAQGALAFRPGTSSAAIRECLLALPGIGPWTAGYLLLRAWRDPDAFPSGDLALRKAAGDISDKELLARSQAWRPWRAYAAVHFWNSLNTSLT